MGIERIVQYDLSSYLETCSYTKPQNSLAKYLRTGENDGGFFEFLRGVARDCGVNENTISNYVLTYRLVLPIITQFNYNDDLVKFRLCHNLNALLCFHQLNVTHINAVDAAISFLKLKELAASASESGRNFVKMR